VRLEWGETLPQTVEHAARLAAGVTVRAGDIIQACDSIVHEGDTETVLQHHLVIDMAAEYLTGELQPGDGVLDVAWASGLALKSMPVEANAAELLADLGVIQ
jgi:8-oxo-dGTP diphosphatase